MAIKVPWSGHSTSIGGVSYTPWVSTTLHIGAVPCAARMRVFVDEHGRHSVQYDLPATKRKALGLFREAVAGE